MDFKNFEVLFLVVILSAFAGLACGVWLGSFIDYKQSVEENSIVELGPNSEYLLKINCESMANNMFKMTWRDNTDENVWYNTSVVGLRNVSLTKTDTVEMAIGKHLTSDNLTKTISYDANCDYIAYFENGLNVTFTIDLPFYINGSEENKWKN